MENSECSNIFRKNSFCNKQIQATGTTHFRIALIDTEKINLTTKESIIL